jgi:phosphatidylserine/phosphatidylglycerophosphate/cardiolipin synthase-like enzyme
MPLMVLKKLFLVLLLAVFSYSFDEIYFLPDQAKEAKSEILKLIDNAQNKIDIAMYNLSYKKFVKALRKAHKKGVEVTVIYDKSDLELPKKFDLIKPKRKQHIKLAIIDDKVAVYGSANWTKQSFRKNYEIINITDDSEKLEKFIRIIKNLKKGK